MVLLRSRRGLLAVAVLALVAALLPILPGGTARAAGHIEINEIRIDQPGADDDEYFELAGPAAASLTGLTYLVIGDGSGGSGVIENVTGLSGSIPGSGFFVAAESTFTLGTADLTTGLNFENSDNVTHLLVSGFTGSNGDDLDTNDDGTLDVTPWSAIVDSIALVETPGSGDLIYSANTVGPDGSFVPGHALRCPGIPPSDWAIGSFFGGDDTPGAANSCPAGATPLTIPEIQGSGTFSPFDGDFVVTTGIVTLESNFGRDFWMQDPDGDGDPATSDGIMVDDGLLLPGAPTVGDLVKVFATVDEQQFGDALPFTRLDSPVFIEVLSSGNPLPAPVALTNLPDVSLQDGIEFWEALEGMRVSVKQGRVVAPTSRFGEFGMVTPADAVPGSGYFAQAKQILLRSLGTSPNEVDYNPERILVDDASVPAIQVRPGDKVKNLIGVVDYTFGMYKLQPQPGSFLLELQDLPETPVSKRSGPNGNTVITSYNVENLFDLNTGIDVIGRIDEDPGSEWSGGGIGTQNETLRRKAGICAGDPQGLDAFDPSVEWDGFPEDTFGGLGSHTVTCTGATELFISEYVEGSSLNKAIEIYNGTGATVDLAAGDYRLEVYFNGSDDAGTAIPLTGTVADGDVYVVADDGADAAILAVTDQTTTASLFNGDDAVVLRIGDKDDAGSTPSAAELETQLTKLVAAIELELRLPEIIVAQEVENTAIAQELADRVNAAAGTDYVAVSFETSDGRGIEVAFLYDDDRVDLMDAFQLSGADVEAAYGPTSASPGREPLYGKFMVEGEVIHIVGNHFKSKGGDDPPFGIDSSLGLPFERITEVQRKMQAQVVRDFVDDVILDADPDALVMVTGDLNDFQFGEPGEGADHPIAILEGAGGSDPLTNLINLEKAVERWTFIFDGNSQVLDHMLVNDALLAKLGAVDVLHFNAGYPASLSSDATTTLRASDHDAVEGRFRLG